MSTFYVPPMLAQLARQAGRSHSNAVYAAKSLGIKPMAFVGPVGVYKAQDATRILQKLKKSRPKALAAGA
jgi:hypothetical protein